jgi:hypothetical protein
MKQKVLECEKDLLIRTHVKLWQRTTFLIYDLTKIFAPIEQEIKQRNLDSLLFAGLKLIRDIFLPQIE